MLGNHKQELKEARRGRRQFSESLRMLADDTIRPPLSLERLSFSEKEGKACSRYGEVAEEEECPKIAGRGWAAMIRKV